jgi:hypothetical protein
VQVAEVEAKSKENIEKKIEIREKGRECTD